MARRVDRLTAIAVAKKSAKGRYADGGGLYLQVGEKGGKSWMFRYSRNGKEHEMGLGSVITFSLAEARLRANRCRQLLADGIDPLAERKEKRASALVEATNARTFDECTASYIRAHRPGWKSPKHGEQWKNTLGTYASPVLGALPVQAINTSLIIKVLEPIWASKNETASRVRGRVERVLDWARARGYRTGENPARWRGHLDKLLPPPRKVQKVAHHAALPYRQVGEFIRQLRSNEGVAPRALEFAILTAARTSEVVGARWSEFDLDAGVWTVPAERMKANREHRVPLSTTAQSVLARLLREGDYVFCGASKNRPLSNMAMLALLRRMGREDLTVHGFRSSFRDWAAELTNFPREVAEAALAHVLSDKTEAAYRRGDLLERRVPLMEGWAAHVSSHPEDGSLSHNRGRAR
jgi:integrase